ncbi:MAG: pentapeptide repeat-containing protein, partial [Candidatus Nitrosopelagicus sp.]
GESSDETTIPGILQKMFDSDSSVQKIEVINVGTPGGKSDSELHLVDEKLVGFSPDLVIVYDGWNDLRADYPVMYTKDSWYLICEIGKANDFDVIITLQPLAGFGNKKLTQQEVVNSLTGETHEGFQLIADKSTYDYMGRELLSLKGNCNTADLRGTFDDISGPIYWDQGHVSDAGNLIVAEKFYEIINEIIFNKKPTESKFHDILSKYNSPAITSHLLSKIGIDIDYTQIKQDLDIKDKKAGNYFYLKNQLGASEKILVAKDLSKADLLKIDLAGRDLSGTNLSGQDLRKVDLTDTILRSANLSFTNLSEQNLSGKDLRGINFTGANLENADLTNISISKVIQIFEPNLTNNPKCTHSSDLLLNSIRSKECGMDVIKNESIRTDFSNANLRGATISTNFMNFVDFSDADMTGMKLSDFNIRACKFNGANLHNITMNTISFISCDFSDAKLNNSKVSAAAFHGVSFHDAKIIDADFHDVLFIDTDLSNADLKDTASNQIFWEGDNNRTCKNNQICN